MVTCFGSEEELAKGAIEAMRIASNSVTTSEESFNIARATKIQKDLHGWIRFLV